MYNLPASYSDHQCLIVRDDLNNLQFVYEAHTQTDIPHKKFKILSLTISLQVEWTDLGAQLPVPKSIKPVILQMLTDRNVLY